MARELITLTWCDTHVQDDGAKEAGQTAVFTFDLPGVTSGPVTYEIDQCETCRKPYADLLAELVEYGRQQTTGKRRPAVAGHDGGHAVQSCPSPGCDYSTTSASGVQSHVRSAHRTTLAELAGTATLPCPADGCGRKFGKPQGLISHVRTAHPDDADALRRGQQSIGTAPAD